ncbi:uncharacterized protein EI97DRAFT_498454 [Westerdykella ornata]|uniref:Protein sip5 n=1 Tax=Westerdykella ornata TaxID=318751 RepID=A0A6A6JVF1_WESOR|nr:uncharacterized protein EI97DRAFT_498454 [Westerdykella ornata]KAF2280215.1 hypothetical protein EI97DRAFT_498454 [Westerdykella ornata]
MGNSQGRESRPGSSRGPSQSSGSRHPSVPTTSAAGGAGGSSRHDVPHAMYTSRSGRGSRHDLSFLGLGSSSDRDPALEPRRETRAEREARKLEKERALRAQERERSIKEESVDGGYLVTLGTYTGPEDFNKAVVRQLQIERRLAPFWKGLNDFSETWTEHQLVAVVNGKPLPAPDEIPDEEELRQLSSSLSADWSPRGSNANINSLTVPITSRSMSQNSDRSSPSHPAFSLPSPNSPMSAPSPSSPFFRGRAKTLAALTTGSRNSSQTEMTPQERQLPKDLYVNGQRIEVFLYKDAAECPICFLYYPPYLNRTRCCDQPICSECFVQIKRPDPHPPEHHEPNSSAPAGETQDEIQLVSEPAACPFCVQPDFGVTYEPPPFRRGIVYAGSTHNHLANAASAMSSSSSLNFPAASPGRRRATSVAANDSSVVTTDMVRPDWAKKLADAKAHALRRAAAATALHNAAYMIGNLEASGSRGFGIGRRRRAIFSSDSATSSGQGTPRREGEGNTLDAGTSQRGESHADLFPGRHSSRRGNRLEDLEELMMMEAIRLSLAAEEERKRKEEKEAAKEAKREEKKKAKEAKKAEKASRKSGLFSASNSSSNLHAQEEPSGSSSGKGKGVDRSGGTAGFNPLTEPTSTLNASSSKDDSQRHLEQSRVQILAETSGTAEQQESRVGVRPVSGASSSASSLADSPRVSSRQSSQRDVISPFDLSPALSSITPHETPSRSTSTLAAEPMLNFESFEQVMAGERKESGDGTDVAGSSEADKSSSPAAVTSPAESSNKSTPDISIQPRGSATADDASEATPTESEDPLQESAATLKPSKDADDDIGVEVIPRAGDAEGDLPSSWASKHVGEMSSTEPTSNEQPTQ